MSQLPGTVPAAQPAEAPPAAPAVNPAPAPATDYIQVPRTQLEAYGGDFHAALSHANQFRDLGDYGDLVTRAKAAGVTPDQLIEAYDAGLERQQQGAGALPAPAGLTMDQLTTALQAQEARINSGLTTRLQTHTKETQEATDRERTLGDALEARDERVDKFITDMGYKLKGEDGKPDPMGDTFWKQYRDILGSGMEATMPAGLTPQQQEDYYASPTDEHFQAANEACAWMKDIKHELAAQVAAAQETTPGATLGAGPGGKLPTPDGSKMTDEQRQEATMANVDLPPELRDAFEKQQAQ